MLELFVIDIPLHGALANYRTSLLESKHLDEKDMYTRSSKINPLKSFAERVSFLLYYIINKFLS